MKLVSPDIGHEKPIIAQFTCDGKNIGPILAIEGVPKSTKAFALILHDPDAVNGDFLHWSVWNIPPDTKTFSAQSLPPGCQEGTTDFSKVGYGGPCPPSGTGTHRYMFELYALRELLQLPEGSDRKTLENALATRAIEKTVLTGLYSRM